MFYRDVEIPKNLPDHFFIYDYKVVKKCLRSSVCYEFASILYLAIIAQIVFLCFHPHIPYQERTVLETMHASFGMFGIDTFRKIFLLPIGFTLVFIMWRVKNYLLNELSLDIDTRIDKIFYMMTPIIFASIVYFTFHPCFMNYWLLGITAISIVTLLLTLKRFYTLSKNNGYRRRIPFRRDPFDEFNLLGYVRQVARWAVLLFFETATIGGCGTLILLLEQWLLRSGLVRWIILTNYLVALIICVIVYIMTTYSKSVRPASIGSYEKEMEIEIDGMSYKKKIYKARKFLKLQKYALEYLKKEEYLENSYLIRWKNDLDSLIKRQSVSANGT